MADNTTNPTSRRRFIKYVGAAGAVGVAGCIGDDDEEADEVIIGSNHPLSGSLGDTGTRMDNAVKLAADMKNEEGGIESLGGAEVTVISGDNEGDQALGGEVTDELVDDGAHVLTGCFSSPVTSAATVAAEAHQIPFVISVSVADDILQADQLNYAYRPQPRSDRMAHDLADMLPAVIRDAGHSIDTAGIYYIDIDFGQSIRDSLREYLPDQNIEIVEEVGVDFGETPDVQATALREADPDLVIPVSYLSETINLMSSMNDIDYQPPFIAGCANEAMNDRGAIADMGDIVEGQFGTNFALNPTIDRADEIRNRYEDEFDIGFDANIAMTFAATEVILAALEEAGSTDSEEINDTLSEITVEEHIAAMPAITFNERGENENAIAPLHQIQDGDDLIIFPEEFAATEVQL